MTAFEALAKKVDVKIPSSAHRSVTRLPDGQTNKDD